MFEEGVLGILSSFLIMRRGLHHRLVIDGSLARKLQSMIGMSLFSNTQDGRSGTGSSMPSEHRGQ